ncbi:MAG: hypothetical protein FJ225_05445 [Lentisphaerae bacterium]|nr:hypothetical protein [Lentisphaerota bacterium]
MRPSNASPRARAIVCALSTLAVGVASLMPGRAFGDMPGLIPHFDKVAHAAMYGWLALVWSWRTRAARGIRPAAVAALCACYGALLEWMQGALGPADRAFSLGDMGANAAGAAAAALWLHLRAR